MFPFTFCDTNRGGGESFYYLPKEKVHTKKKVYTIQSFLVLAGFLLAPLSLAVNGE
jgi:hypothetical protein